MKNEKAEAINSWKIKKKEVNGGKFAIEGGKVRREGE